ncbi:MAG: ABC transporter permease [Defluviitaleaceae bacterium]|nr:ABC transporter permease [Defluviitaleaceae bacterium]
MDWNVFQLTLASAVRMSIPLILVSTGGIFSIKSGIVAMGLEGMMLFGAFSAAYVAYVTGNPYLGVAASAIGGMLMSMMLGVLIIKFKIDQVIGGVGLNIFALGMTTLLMVIVWGNRGRSAELPRVHNFDLPLIGRISPLFFIAIILVLAAWFIIYKTKYGLHLRMTGENPQAAMSVGIQVKRVKYIAMAATGALAGLSGSYFSIDQLNIFTRNISAGRGFIGLSICILGRYHPFGIVAGSFLFGIADALQIFLQRYNIPGQLLSIIPFLVTLLVIVFGVRYVKAPAAIVKNLDVDY